LKTIKVRRSCLSTLLWIFLAGLGVTLTGISCVRTILDHYRAELPDVSTLTYYEPSLTTRIYANDGTLIGTLYKEARTWTKLDDMSPYVEKALLAIEDTRFREHHGVDPIGVLRAIASKIAGGSDSQGASTITMQLARNLFLSPKQTLDRKLKEVLVAVEIEKNFTKNEILELYLNQIYFGEGAYGIGSASMAYFGKKPKDLTAAEASLIAGLPQAPSDYSPFVSEKMAKIRQKEVLDRMLKVGYLSKAEYQKSLKEVAKQKFKQRKRRQFQVLKVPYFTSFVIKQLYKQFDEEMLLRGGLNIYTTVDLKLQEKGEKIVREKIATDSAALNVHQAAFVTVENGTGYIRAMVGGTGWRVNDQFNRAWQAVRQPGSSFKTFVYSTAIECGYSPATPVLDAPINVNGWEPKNSDGKFFGSMSMAVALQQSRNVVAVRLILLAGPKRVIQTARKMGITAKLNPYPSLALGAADVTVLEMADAISTFPNGGVRIPASPFKLITDRDGNVVVDNRFPDKKDVLSESTASSMMEMMRGVITGGTGTAAYMPDHEAGGKTGTTDDFRDAWFVGYTRDYTTAVWCGNDDYSKMWNSFGGDVPATIWHSVMTYALRNTKSSKLPITHPSKVGVLMCADSKQRCGPNCPNVYREMFPRDGVPTQFCAMHGAPSYAPPSASYSHTSDSRNSSPTDSAAKAAATAAPPIDIDPDSTSAPIPTQVEIPTEIPLEPPPSELPVSSDVVPVAPQPVELPPPDAAPVEMPAPPPPQPVEVPVAPPPGEAP
jgi:penicillin-binding protein 1A